VRRLVPPGTLPVGTITLDGPVLAFALAVSALTGVIFGVAPAFQAGHAVPAGALSQGGRWHAGGRTRVRRGLVVAQVALVVPLVLGAALMARGLVALHAVDPGFVVKDILTMDLSLRGATYAPPHRQRAFFDAVEARVRQLPGVLGVGSINEVPLDEAHSGIGIEVEGKADQPGQRTSAQYRVVTPGYFKTISVPFVAGRDFSPSDARLALPLIRSYPQQPLPPDFDRPQPIPVAIVNASMARQLWPDGAVGRRFKVLFSPWITVAGVVRDMRTESLRSAAGPEFYLSAAQEPQASMGLLVRTSGAPADAAPAIRSTIAGVDPSIPIASMRTLEDIVGHAFHRPTFLSALLGTFAGIALGLMTVGVYGLLAFTTAQRLPEIGVRLALGATRRQIHTLVLREAGMMTGIGVAIGFAAALALGRFLGDQLYEVTPSDPITLLTAVMIVVAIAGLACWAPVRRAGQVEPMPILRHD
jgi:putative ABC transport system permease protein